LQRGIRDQDQPKASRYTEQLSSASEHLLALIDDLMDISRMEAGQAPVSLVPTNLNRLAEEVAGMLRPQMEKGGTRLHIHLPNNLGVVMMDEVKVRQILLNLLSNAARFTDHGNVTLSMAVLPPADSRGERTLELQVSDDGIGIALEDQERIFDAFSQANSDIERRSGGTGLGLAVTRNLCELLKGDIHLDSEPGKGAVFTVSLPLPAEADTDVAFRHSPEVVEEEADPPPDRRRRIFIVEDNRINRELMEEYLRLEGFEVASAGTGEEALEKIPEAEPDIVLMDMNLPGMQGDEATRRLKSRWQTADLPIIAVSAYTGADIRKRAMDAGCREYHTKPVDFPSLVKRMWEILP
jgi:CheY-like chemotaxis protein